MKGRISCVKAANSSSMNQKRQPAMQVPWPRPKSSCAAAQSGFFLWCREHGWTHTAATSVEPLHPRAGGADAADPEPGPPLFAGISGAQHAFAMLGHALPRRSPMSDLSQAKSKPKVSARPCFNKDSHNRRRCRCRGLFLKVERISSTDCQTTSPRLGACCQGGVIFSFILKLLTREPLTSCQLGFLHAFPGIFTTFAGFQIHPFTLLTQIAELP